MPNKENFTPHRQVRIEDDLWVRFGELVGDRHRSADLKAYIEWKLANPNADLSAAPKDQVLDFLVRVTLLPDDRRRAEIVPLPGAHGNRAEDLRAEIRQAIADHFNPEASPPATKRARKTGR